ncbi:MAG TPA: DUF302 domain-containing protein, partial [Campylobacterales bacterium]|nr:DUF302 domain-containing protein [Campylobacterales bacterium]
AKQALILEHKSPFDYNKTVETIINRINAKEGWKVISVIDQAEEIRKGGGADVGKVTIVKYCNAKFAGEMLSEDERKKMAVSMPISIAVYEKSTGECVVSVSNGVLMSKIYGGETEDIIEDVSKDVEEILGFMAFKFSRF